MLYSVKLGDNFPDKQQLREFTTFKGILKGTLHWKQTQSMSPQTHQQST